MKAVVYYGRNDYRVEDVSEPECGPGSVRVQVAHNGICGTDLHEIYDGPIFIGTARHPLTGGSLPQILGHEFSGTVVEVGKDVGRVKVGDRVAIEPTYGCNECLYCKTDRNSLCIMAYGNDATMPYGAAVHGLSSNGGGLSERTVVSEDMVFLIPDSMSFELGALVEPMSVGMHAIRRGLIEKSDTVVVHGGGPIGISIILGLAAIGVERIIGVEPKTKRREIIAGLPTETVLNPDEVDIVEAVKELTGGFGADVSFDAAGTPIAFNTALRSARNDGQFIMVATHPTTEIEPNDILVAQSVIRGSCGYDSVDYVKVIELMGEGHYPTDLWVRHYPLDEVATAVETAHEGEFPKVLIDLPA